jgi:hypothetical protein
MLPSLNLKFHALSPINPLFTFHAYHQIPVIFVQLPNKLIPMEPPDSSAKFIRAPPGQWSQSEKKTQIFALRSAKSVRQYRLSVKIRALDAAGSTRVSQAS